MSRVFLAFLGTNDYLPCNYVLNGVKVSNVRFVQEALVSILCKNWEEGDKIIIFLTENAKNKNWVDNGHKDRDNMPLQREGLRRRLESLGLMANILAKDVPEGRSEREIWDIFEIVLNEISDGDEVVFDITHGFRSLPMLVITILNYARVLKSIKINGIYYGAFESLGNVSGVERKDVKDRNAPIFNLTPFAGLFNWTGAIDDFLTYGDAKNINAFTKEEVKPILRNTKGKDTYAKNLKNTGEQLEKLTKLIQTSRGASLIRDFDFKNLKKLINLNKKSTLKPLNPLLDKISNKIKGFRNNDVVNGYAAVKWCIEHNLIQQGYTIFQETMITEVVVKHFGKDEIANRDKRRLVSQAISIKHRNIPENEWDKPARSNKNDVRRVIDGLDDNFVKIYDSISQYRNDINHAGFGENSHKPEYLEKQLKEYYEKFKGGIKDV